MSHEEIKNYALVEIDKHMRNYGKSLQDFEPMSIPPEQYFHPTHKSLIHDELRYDKQSLSVEHQSRRDNLNYDQRQVYDSIVAKADKNKRGVFFVYGYGGTGKTCVWRTLSAYFRSKGEIVLNMASSSITALLLPDRRTTHSRFSLPLTPYEGATCNIDTSSPLAELIRNTKLIIWDETPMMHKHQFKALDKSLRDVMKDENPAAVHKPFGGKTIIFDGDFRQILPVIPQGKRADIVHATINSSYVWANCKVLKLTKNMRL